MSDIDVKYPRNNQMWFQAVLHESAQDDARIDDLAVERNADEEAAVVASARQLPLLSLL